MGRRLATLAIALAVLLTASASCETALSPGYETPEDAVRAFCAAFVAGDFDAAMSACCIEEMADGYDFSAYAEQMGATNVQTQIAPATSDTYRALNRASLAGTLALQYKMLCYGFLAPDLALNYTMISKDAASPDEIEGRLALENLSDLSLVRVDPPDKEILENEKTVKSFAALAACYGASEMTERVVLWAYGGRGYASGFMLYRYETGWKVASLVSMIAGFSGYGTPEEVTPADYFAILGE